MTKGDNTTQSTSKDGEKKTDLERIWSDEYWEVEAEKIELGYWEILKHYVPNVDAPKGRPHKTEHRIEEFVRKMSRRHGIGNLHVGLTSSDLEENIRVKRLEQSVDIIYNRLASFHYKLCAKVIKNGATTAYTHLKPAGTVHLWDRFNVSRSTFCQIKKPRITYKGIGGSIGTLHAQRYMGIKYSELKDGLKFSDRVEANEEMWQQHCTQTSNHVTDHLVASWLALQSALLAKVAGDIRMMFALGQVENKHKDIGSTAMPHKSPNPWRWERICGMAESIYPLPSVVSRVLAGCLLERTLTDQSVLTKSFEDAFRTVNGMIDDAGEGLETLVFTPDGGMVSLEHKFIDLVKKGHGREEAHKIINEEYQREKRQNISI